MIEYLNNLDATVLLWLNGFHNTFFDIFMDLVSNKWVWTPMYFSIFIVCLLHTKFQPKLLVILALFGITFALSDYTCAEIIRPLVNRPRPSNFESGIGHLVHIVNDYRGWVFLFLKKGILPFSFIRGLSFTPTVVFIWAFIILVIR